MIADQAKASRYYKIYQVFYCCVHAILLTAIESQFLLYGNINDVFPAELEGSIATLGLPDYLKELLTNQDYILTVKYEPLVGFSLLSGSFELFEKLTGEKLPASGVLPATLDKVAVVASALAASTEGHTGPDLALCLAPGRSAERDRDQVLFLPHVSPLH
jgi:hypothetical protein